MSARITQRIERLRSSIWLVPAVCTVLAGILAFALIEFDTRYGAQTGGLPWSFVGGAESARSVLSTIAGSMITVAGTVYSITIVVLTLASVQFAPRVLGSFMRDRANQVVLGFFVATFAYCLLVLRSIRSTDEGEFVPHTAVTGGVDLALISLAMLIYFIDHIFHAIQVSNIIANVSHQTMEQINHLYPKTWHEGQSEPKTAPDPALDWAPVLAAHSGYLQFVVYESLLRVATRAGIIIRQDRSVGSFVIAGAPLVSAAP